MEDVIDNLINGNLFNARKKARRFRQHEIMQFLNHEMGWSHNRAFAAASFLKGYGSFQTYCDAQ